MQRREGGRVAQVAEFEAGGRMLVVYNLHLESRSVSAREGQLRETLADARRYGPETAVVIAGDLNTHFHPDSYARELRAEGFRNCFGDRQPRTHKMIGAVDWIFVRGPLECSGAAVHREFTASDHFPLTATLAIRETPPEPVRSNGEEWQGKGTGSRSR
jgi:endonuclease/exonuclease/phosphatase family metal-dependent hydrolase